MNQLNISEDIQTDILSYFNLSDCTFKIDKTESVNGFDGDYLFMSVSVNGKDIKLLVDKSNCDKTLWFYPDSEYSSGRFFTEECFVLFRYQEKLKLISDPKFIYSTTKPNSLDVTYDCGGKKVILDSDDFSSIETNRLGEAVKFYSFIKNENMEEHLKYGDYKIYGDKSCI